MDVNILSYEDKGTLCSTRASSLNPNCRIVKHSSFGIAPLSPVCVQHLSSLNFYHYSAMVTELAHLLPVPWYRLR